MQINAKNLDNLKKMYNIAWAAGLVTKPSEDLSAFFTSFPSMSASNFYSWFNQLPKFREWVGERQYQNVEANKFEILNKKFEQSFNVTTDEIEDDQYGQLITLIQTGGAQWDKLKAELLLNVFLENQICFTGKAFLADDHAYGENTIDNLTTSVLSVASFEAAFVAAAEYKFSNDELCETMFTHLICGPSNRAVAHQIVEAANHSVDGAAIANPNFGRVEVHISPKLAGAHAAKWFLCDNSGVIKPLALQVRKEVQAEFYGDTQLVKRTGKAEFLADGRVAAGPTFPHLVYGKA